MRPVDFEESNLTLGAPPGAESFVDPLRVRRTRHGELISCWELDDEDLERLRKTRKLYLIVLCRTGPPPVALTTEKPAFDGRPATAR